MCATNNIGVIVARPMLGGLLTGTFTRETAAYLPDDDWRKCRNWFQDPELGASLALVERLRPIAACPTRPSPNWQLRGFSDGRK